MEDLVEEMRAVTMRPHTVAQKNEDCRGLAAPLIVRICSRGSRRHLSR